MEKKDFEKSLKIPKIVLGWAGIEIFPKNHNSIKDKLIKSWIFWFNFICLSLAVLGEFHWLVEKIYKRQSFEELCMTVPCFTISILGIAKFNCLYFNRHIVNNVVEKLKTIHPCDNEEETDDGNEERKILNNSLKFLSKIIMFFCYSCVIVIVVFGLASPSAMAYDYITTGSTDFKLPFRIKYFFEVSTLNRWALVYVYQLFTMFVVSSNLFSADTLFYALCTYIQMHFKLLCLKFENVVSISSKAETSENFRKAVKRHQDLIELVDKIELLYSKSTLCNIILSSLLICLSGFIVTFVQDIGAVSSFVAFLAMNLTQISLLCYFGDMLNSASTRISQSVYNCSWCDAELNIKKNVLVVIIRAQKPCKVTAMKFADLNLNALSAILRTSWSYFALLKTMYD